MISLVFFNMLLKEICGLFKHEQLNFVMYTGNQLISSKCLTTSPLPLEKNPLLLYAREVCVLYLT